MEVAWIGDVRSIATSSRAPSARPGQAKPGKASAEHTALGIEREMQHEA